MKNVDLSNSIAAEMDKALNSDDNKKLFSNASVLEKLAFKKVSEDDKTTEVEVELENALQKTASADLEVSEVSEGDVVEMLLQASEDLDTLGFDKLSVYSAKLANQLMVEAKAKSKTEKSDKKSKEDKKSKPKMDMKERMKKMREMQGKGKKDKKDKKDSKEDKKDSKKSSK